MNLPAASTAAYGAHTGYGAPAGDAQKIARTIGVDLGESSTGGGSDGNFTSARYSNPGWTGAVGEDAHAAKSVLTWSACTKMQHSGWTALGNIRILLL